MTMVYDYGASDRLGAIITLTLCVMQELTLFRVITFGRLLDLLRNFLRFSRFFSACVFPVFGS